VVIKSKLGCVIRKIRPIENGMQGIELIKYSFEIPMFKFFRERGHSRIFMCVSRGDFVVVNTSMVGVVAV
jgi:hypothetical protein